eukprot:scaffold2806_cov178-Amphora_coffeaeformis.AAC.2
MQHFPRQVRRIARACKRVVQSATTRRVSPWWGPCRANTRAPQSPQKERWDILHCSTDGLPLPIPDVLMPLPKAQSQSLAWPRPCRLANGRTNR